MHETPMDRLRHENEGLEESLAMIRWSIEDSYKQATQQLLDAKNTGDALAAFGAREALAHLMQIHVWGIG